MNIARLGEFGLIDRLSKLIPAGKGVIKGIGDDTAVLPFTKDKYQLLTTDMMVEGAHFTKTTNPVLVGRKALACNISDIAAMGGVPSFAVVSIGLPSTTKVKYVEEIYKGMASLAKEFRVGIVGGDTVKSNKVTINVALLGEVNKTDLVTRDGARPQDWVFVTGPLGGSLKSGRHLTFTPRLAQAQFLVKNFKPSAMMDLSDGLAGDLNHILKASQVGVQLIDWAIPCHKGATLKQAMSDGEDFELLFTLPMAKAIKLMAWQAEQKAFYFYPIGEIVKDQKQRAHGKGFTHY